MTAQRSLRNRPETLADSAGIGRLHHAAFVDPQVAPLVVAIRASPGYLPDVAFVAVRGQRLVGHVG